jgi:hypothetical protein
MQKVRFLLARSSHELVVAIFVSSIVVLLLTQPTAAALAAPLAEHTVSGSVFTSN